MPKDLTDGAAPEMVTYYIESNDGMHRLNIPKTWNVESLISPQGYTIVKMMDEEGTERLLFTNVQSLRDSSTLIQELVPQGEPNETTGLRTYAWEDRNHDTPLSRYAADAVETAGRRRRRIQMEDSIDTYPIDDGF